MSHIEVERKFLVPATFQTPEDWQLESSGQQLNHYFNTVKDSIRTRYEYIEYPKYTEEGEETNNSEEVGCEHNLYLVRKWKEDGSNADNGTIRQERSVWVLPELTSRMPENIQDAAKDLENYVDSYLLACGATYKSKWSRTIDTYTKEDRILGEIQIDLENNSGYGLVIEIEKVFEEKMSEADQAEALEQIDSYGQSLGLIVLDDELLGYMFQFYNEHWEEYYLTNKTLFQDKRFTDCILTTEKRTIAQFIRE